MCGSCKKVWKSKGGLTRHQTAVHGTMTNIAQTSTTEPELKLAEDYIMQVVQEAKRSLKMTCATQVISGKNFPN